MKKKVKKNSKNNNKDSGSSESQIGFLSKKGKVNVAPNIIIKWSENEKNISLFILSFFIRFRN